MNQKKCLLRCCTLYLSLLSVIIFYTHCAYASTPCLTCTGYSCTLTGVSAHFPSPGLPVYDDGYTNYPASTDGISNWNGIWNCNRRFIFTEYVGAASNINLTFQYAGSEVYSPLPTTSHDVYVYNKTTGLWYDGASSSWVATMPAPINIPDLDTYSLPTQYYLPAALTASPGELNFAYYRHGATVGVDSPDIRGIIVLIPKLQSIQIEQTPICADFLGPQYNFVVHTVPELYSILSISNGEYLTVASGCDEAFQPYIQLSLLITAAGYVSGSTIAVQQTWPPFMLSMSGPFNIDGYDWGVWLDSSISTPADTNLHNYWLLPCDLAPYLSSCSGCSGCGVSSLSGDMPSIQVAYTDFLDYPIDAPLGDTSDVIIENPPGASLVYPGSATGAPLGPPNATGVPSSSYDVYNYTVSGTETWTPANNPIANARGVGSVDSIIRIQNNLNIAPGGVLKIKPGMILEMGPEATITIDTATTSSGSGGQLYIDSGFITAYRGCGDTSGTDHSTWHGIIVEGIPTWYVADTWAPPVGQGVLFMAYTTLSYADTAIQNGIDAAHGGGMLMPDQNVGVLI